MSGIPWTIELFGSLRARCGPQVITHFRTQMTGELLAYLACFPQRPLRREELIELLWPERELESGRNCLRMALSALKQQFQVGTETPANVILADRHTVQLNAEAFLTDKAEFEKNIAAAHRARRAGAHAEQSALLKQAVSLYRSDLLPNYDSLWVEGERKRLADAHLLALRRLIELLAKERALDEALHYAQSAVAADPLREESHRVLIRIHGALRCPGAALRQYQELSRVLEEELGATPSEKTRSVLEQITQGDHGDSTNGNTVTTFAGSASPPPPMPAAPLPIAQGVLPAARTRFFGREDCQAQILEMLDTPETRLVTLTGLGGTGKTRLALSIAEKLYPDFHGAVWFVPLAALSSPERIPEALLQAMDLRGDGATSALEQVVQALSGRTSLLVLDNFEHVVEGGGVVLQRLLDRLPALTCLVTSRQRLNVAGEYEFAVAPLATPQSPGTPERLQEFPSVQLFVDRARAARRDFELTASNAASVAALCHHLEGVPLSIELAAAYVQALTPAQILSRLAPRLPLLVNRQRDAIPRHASLRATLDWSFELLAPPVQRFLARLSVFRDGWYLEAAESVCAEPQALEYLLQLRERSLVTLEEVGDAMRYRLLETVREYAAEQLAREEVLATSRLHTEYFLAQAEAAEAELVGADAAQWLEALEREHPNFRAALAFALSQAIESGDGPGAVASVPAISVAPLLPAHPALRLAAALWRFWYLHGHYDEGGDWLDRVLSLGSDGTPACMKAWRGVGNLAYDRGQFSRARAAYTQLLSLSRQTGSRQEEAAALGSLANLALAQDDLIEARLLLEESLTLFRQCSNPRGAALVLGNLALVALDSGDPAGACTLHRESLELFEQVNDTQNIALALNNLGHAAMQAGDYVTARQQLLASLALARTLASPFLELYVVVNLACLMAHQHRWRQAALLCGVTDSRLEEHRASLLPKAAAYYRQQREAIQNGLSAGEFAQICEQGRNMRLDQVHALVDEMYAHAIS